MKLHRLALVVAILLAFVSSSHALLINISEQGNNVVVAGSGKINLTGLSPGSTGAFPGNFIAPNSAYMALRGPADGSMVSYLGLSGPAAIGSGGFAFAEIAVSNYAFGFHGPTGRLYLDDNYAGAEIVFSQTYLNDSFATLGLTPGTYIWEWLSDSITLNVGAATAGAVPEPATLLLLGSGLAGLAGLRRRRNN